MSEHSAYARVTAAICIDGASVYDLSDDDLLTLTPKVHRALRHCGSSGDFGESDWSAADVMAEIEKRWRETLTRASLQVTPPEGFVWSGYAVPAGTIWTSPRGVDFDLRRGAAEACSGKPFKDFYTIGGYHGVRLTVTPLGIQPFVSKTPPPR